MAADQRATAPALPAAGRLSDVLGAQRLRKVAGSGRPAHAYLLVGPRGSGRRTAASALAGALLCAHPGENADACGTCPSCRALAAGRHADVHVLAGHRLDDARALTRAAALRPVHGGRAAFILPNADELTPEAVAALLKPIEEPSPETLFILTAVSPDHVPETIVSRCQVVPLLPAPSAELVPWLTQRGVPPEAAPGLADAAGGRPGRALALASDPAWQQRHTAARDWIAGAGRWRVGEALTRAAAAAEATDLDEVLAVLRHMARDAAAAGDQPGLLAACDGFAAAATAASAVDGHVTARLTWEVLALRLRRSSRVRYNLPKR